MRLGTLRTDRGRRVIVAVRNGYLDVMEALGGQESAANHLESLIASWNRLGGRLQTAVDTANQKEAQGTVYPADEAKLAPPLEHPQAIYCIGLNYLAHAQETGMKIHDHPEIFMRTAGTLAGPRDDVWLPSVSEQLDLEVELCVVVGRGGRHIPRERSLDAVFGWTVFNDLSVRDFQKHGTQWTAGKNFDRSGPCGPLVVTRDEIADPGHLAISSDIDGYVMQEANTDLLIFNVPRIIEEISAFATLRPGDLIATGTPPGVGMGRTPKRWLKPSETVTCSIESIGSLKNKVVPEPESPQGDGAAHA